MEKKKFTRGQKIITKNGYEGKYIAPDDDGPYHWVKLSSHPGEATLIRDNNLFALNDSPLKGFSDDQLYAETRRRKMNLMTPEAALSLVSTNLIMNELGRRLRG